MAIFSTTGSDTYPAGHIIQTTTATIGTTSTGSMQNNGNNTFADTVVQAAITTSSSSNSVIIHAKWNIYVNNTSTDAGYGFRFKKSHSGGTSYPDQLSSMASSGNHHSDFYTDGRTLADFTFGYSQSMEDPSGGVAGAITYTLQASMYNAESFNVGGMSGRWSIWLQEVKR